MPRQMPLPLRVHARTVLVATETARAVTGLDADSLASRAGSELAWVFDVSPGPGIGCRELRWWLPELQAFVAEQPFLRGWEELHAAVCPAARETIGTGELGQVLCLSRPSLARLAGAGQLERRQNGKGKWVVTRSSVWRFLTERIL
jgi:hypothetical protein